MKHALLGAGLIIYSIAFSTAIFEPTDLIVSTTYITLLYNAFGDTGIILAIISASTGYCALVLGIALIGHSATKHIPILNRFHKTMSFIIHHPIKTVGIVFAFSLVFAYIVMLNLGMI